MISSVQIGGDLSENQNLALYQLAKIVSDLRGIFFLRSGRSAEYFALCYLYSNLKEGNNIPLKYDINDIEKMVGKNFVIDPIDILDSLNFIYSEEYLLSDLSEDLKEIINNTEVFRGSDIVREQDLAYIAFCDTRP